MALEETQVPFLPRGVRVHQCQVRQGWFLLAPERAVKLDQIGVAILGAVDGTRSLQDVVAKLASDFNAPPKQISGDVLRFLDDLLNRRMLEVRS